MPQFPGEVSLLTSGIAIAQLVKGAAVIHLGKVGQFVADHIIDQPIGQQQQSIGESDIAPGVATTQLPCASGYGKGAITHSYPVGNGGGALRQELFGCGL